MKNLGNSSATATPPLPDSSRATPPRKGFALTGPSVAIDPRTHAVRGDLADVRLAEYVFAPHYAAPLDRRLGQAADLRTARDPASGIAARLAAGDAFEVLEFAGDTAWGVAPAGKLVGYLPAAALASA